MRGSLAFYFLIIHMRVVKQKEQRVVPSQLQFAINDEFGHNQQKPLFLWELLKNKISRIIPATRQPSIPPNESWWCMCQKAQRTITTRAVMKKQTFCSLRLRPHSQTITCPSTQRNQRRAHASTAPTRTWTIQFWLVSWNSQQEPNARNPIKMHEMIRLRLFVVWWMKMNPASRRLKTAQQIHGCEPQRRSMAAQRPMPPMMQITRMRIKRRCSSVGLIGMMKEETEFLTQKMATTTSTMKEMRKQRREVWVSTSEERCVADTVQ